MLQKLLLILLLSMSLETAMCQNTSKTYLFVGTYTGDKSDKGIYVYEFNLKTGQLKKVSNAENITNPSFLSISPNGRFLYSCTDTRMPNSGSVSAFRIDTAHGKLIFINKQPSGGDNPVYLTVHRNNKFIINANYTEASVSVFTANENGGLNPYVQLIKFSDSSIIKQRQDQAHTHSAVFSPDNDYLLLPDLGADKIRIFKFDSSKRAPLTATEDFKTVPGSGPRHFAFHPNNKSAYCIEELSGMVSAYLYDNGKLNSIQRIFSNAKTHDAYGGADIHLSPDGLFLYASNRGKDENTISIFSVDPLNEKLKLVGHQSTYGDHPRNFTLDPTGHFLLVANQNSNNIVVFKRNLLTGLLTRVGQDIQVPGPSCLQMRTYGR